MDILEDGPFIAPGGLPTPPGLSVAGVCAGARDIKRRHIRAGSPRQSKPDFHATAGYLGAVHRDQNSAQPLRWTIFMAMRVHDGERAVEAVGDAGDVLAESAVGIAGLGDADDQKVIALARLAGDRIGIVRFLLPGGDLDAAGLFLVRMRSERRRGLGGLFDLLFRASAIRFFGSGFPVGRTLVRLSRGFFLLAVPPPRFLVASVLAQIEG